MLPDRGRVILGLDPGTARTGYGVIEQQGSRLVALDYGVITTPNGSELPDRLAVVFAQIGRLLALHRPGAAAVESLFFNVNVRTALAVGQARGVALLACSQAGCTLFEYTPQQVKQAVAGYGKADKRQVQDMVRVLLGLRESPHPDDAADALGIALCHAHTQGFRTRVARALGTEPPSPTGRPPDGRQTP
jgi:crossover junction endodeoxyribonuclease RuvC